MANVTPLKVAAGRLLQFQSGDTISTTIAPGSGTSPTATSGQQAGVGTSYALTTTSARVVFGTTSPDVSLPAAGTYLIFGLARIQPGANVGDDHRIKLHNVTTATDIGTETAAPSSSSDDMTLPVMQITTVAAASTVVLFARNATSARGVIATTVTHLGYVRLA